MNIFADIFAKRHAQRLFTEAKRLVREERLEAALLKLSQALKCRPSTTLYDYRGVVLTLLGRHHLAMDSFTQALLCTHTLEERARVYFHRSLLSGREQAYRLALRDSEQAMHLAPGNAAYRDAYNHFVYLVSDDISTVAEQENAASVQQKS